jgi:hypothetical protein
VQDDLEPAGVRAEPRDGVLLGGARVDDERLGELAGDLDLRAEGPLLVGARRVVAVVVQPGLADRAAAGMRRELAQVLGDGVVIPGGEVGVAADGGEHLVVGVGGGERAAAGLGVHADGEDARDTLVARRRDELRLRRRAAVEVGVGVDHCCLGKSGGSFSTSAPPGSAP